jgi:hypothetical protein
MPNGARIAPGINAQVVEAMTAFSGDGVEVLLGLDVVATP